MMENEVNNIGMTKTMLENLLSPETKEKLLKLKAIYESSNKAQKAPQKSFTLSKVTKSK